MLSHQQLDYSQTNPDSMARHGQHVAPDLSFATKKQAATIVMCYEMVRSKQGVHNEYQVQFSLYVWSIALAMLNPVVHKQCSVIEADCT